MTTQFPRVHGVPTLTAAQMAEVDRLLVEVYQIGILQTMENAGRSLATLGRAQFLKGQARGKAVLILAGAEGKGGAALAAGRRLHNWGAQVNVVLSRPAHEFKGPAGQQLRILQEMGVVVLPEPATGADLIVDGLLGYRPEDPPQGQIAELIQWTNRQLSPVLSLEVPSGLDADSGVPARHTIRASATLALALPITGILENQARSQVGEIFLADISVPSSLYHAPKLGLKVGTLFSSSDIVKIR